MVYLTQEFLDLLAEFAADTDISVMGLLLLTASAKRKRLIQFLSAIHCRFFRPEFALDGLPWLISLSLTTSFQMTSTSNSAAELASMTRGSALYRQAW